LLSAIARCSGGAPDRHEGPPAGDYILVVDDEPIIRRFVSLFFNQHGFETVAVPNADAARDQILRERPLAVMLDIEMPGRTGLDLLRELNTKGIKPPTVIMTGVEENSIGVEAESLGIIGFLPKPCNSSYMAHTLLPKIEMLTR